MDLDPLYDMEKWTGLTYHMCMVSCMTDLNCKSLNFKKSNTPSETHCHRSKADYNNATERKLFVKDAYKTTYVL